MRREKKKRNKIIIGLVSILLLMTAGYAAFQTNLNIKGTSKINSNWDIRITSVTSGTSVGNAENAKTPTWTNLTASMEANLYEKGDAMEYEVTVENKGTFDAKLENILTNIKSNNEAIKISFSGYTKGEKLYKNSSKVVNVKIEYNKDYEGTAPNTSSEVEITLDYGQAEGGTITPTNDYLVTYDYKTNGGTSSNSQNEYLSEGSNVDLSYIASKSGWTFAGWNTNKDATTGLTTLEMKNADVTLYAIFKKTINVTYTKSTGITSIGKTSDSCIMYNLSSSCQITLPSITASTGYGVDGWYNSSNTKVGTEGTKVNVSNDKTSYTAKGKENSYTLTYNYNGATGGNSTTSKAVTYNSTYGTLPNPTRSYVVTYNYNNATGGNTTANATSNYTFNGWYKESAFSNPVTSSSVYNIASNSTIHAKWTGTSITLPSPTRTGYTFGGWYSDSSLTNKVGDGGASYTPTSNQILYAKWTVNGYAVTYNYSQNGGTSSTKTSATVNYGSAIDLTPTATKSGWTFVGWNTDKDATVGLTSLNISASNVTLYAIYRKESITLTAKFNENGATLSSTTNLTCTLPAVYNNNTQAGSCNVTAPTITRSEYSIIGYNTDASSTTNNGSYNTTSKALTLTTSNNNSTWYSITSKDVTITFNKNGASTQTNDSGTAVGDTTVMRSCTMYNTNTSCNVTSPTIVGASGFSVVGYNTAASSTTSAWNQATSKAASANATYYAVTKSSAAYTATFNANGATSIGATSLSCYRYNGASSCNITAPSITRAGFTITGWNTTASATTSALNVGATLTLTSNPTYYAITKKIVTVTFNKGANVSAVGASSGTCTIQNTATNCSMATPTITPSAGYTSVGWSTTNGATSGTAAGSNLTGLTANATYYANALDKTAPTAPAISNSSNGGWTNGTVTIKVTSTDSGSGIDHYEWYENGAWTTRALTTANGSGTISFSGERNTTIQFRAVDKAGNISAVSTTPVKIDTTKPTGSIAFTGKTGTSGSTAGVYLFGSSVGTAPYASSTTGDNSSGVKSSSLTCSSGNTAIATPSNASNSKVNISVKSRKGSANSWHYLQEYANVNCTLTVTDNANNSYSVSKNANFGNGWYQASAETKCTSYNTGNTTATWNYINGMNKAIGWVYTYWYKTNNNVYYYTNSSGNMLRDWQKIDGSWYFLVDTCSWISQYYTASGYGYPDGGMIWSDTLYRKSDGQSWSFNASGQCNSGSGC